MLSYEHHRTTVAGLRVLLLFVLLAIPGRAQSQPLDQAVVTLARGGSELLRLPADVTRVAVADTAIANPVVVSPREVLVNGRAIGNTTLLVWDQLGHAQTYSVEVTFDAAALNRVFASVFPGEEMEAVAHGNIVVLTGTVSGAAVADRMVAIARGTGAEVIEHFTCIRPSTSC